MPRRAAGATRLGGTPSEAVDTTSEIAGGFDSASASDVSARRRFDKGRRRIVEPDGQFAASDDSVDEEGVEARNTHDHLSPPDEDGGNSPTDQQSQLLPGQIKLVVEQGRLLGEQFLLSESSLLLGRYDVDSGLCPDIDLTAQDPAYVHRRHARLRFDAERSSLHLVDLGGRNGTFVNNQPVTCNGSVTLRLGDKVRIGRVVMRLRPAPEMGEQES